MASCTLEETLQRLNVSDGTTFPASLFRSKSSGQLLYLEAGKDFVDALLSFLLLPVSTIIRMLTTGGDFIHNPVPPLKSFDSLLQQMYVEIVS